MTIKFSNSFRTALEDGVILIYTGKHTNNPESNKYTFKTSSLLAIDYELIEKDLTRENPLAIIHRNDGYHRAVVHVSILQKTFTLFGASPHINPIFDWKKT